MLDKKRTKTNVKAVLNVYRLLKQLASDIYIPKVTAMFSFEARSKNNTASSAIEKHIIRQITAQEKMIEIETAINQIEADKRYILVRKYCQQKVSDIEIYIDMEISESEFYRRLDKALLTFAERYRSGELLVFENEKSIEWI